MVSLSLGFYLDAAKRIGGILVLVGLLVGGWTDPSTAQSYRDSDSRYGSDRLQKKSQDHQQSSSSNLPDWAEPSQNRSSDTRSTPSFGKGSGQNNSAAPPDPPDDPQQVPVDGGLALLAAAGAGYAVRKLNEDDDEEDDLP